MLPLTFSQYVKAGFEHVIGGRQRQEETIFGSDA